MTDLEYLLVFKTTGIPIYSRCFGHFCGILMVVNPKGEIIAGPLVDEEGIQNDWLDVPVMSW